MCKGNNNDEKNEYAIYDYLKKNPSVMISCVSAVVLVISFILKGLIYVNECRYLEYWHLDENMIDVNAPNRIYEYVAIGFLYVMTVMYFRFIEVIIEKRQPKKLLICCEKSCLKRVEKVISRRIRVLIRESKREKNVEGKKKADKEIEKLKKGINVVRGYKKYRKKICGNMGIVNFLLYFFAIIGFTGVIYLFDLFCGLSMSIAADIFVAIIMAVIPTITFNISEKFGSIAEEKKTNKELSLEKRLEKYLELLRAYEKREDSHMTEKDNGLGVRNLFHKSKLKMLISCAVILLVLMIGVIDSQGKESLVQKKTFEIVEYDDVCYAIIYKDNDFIYLEEAEVIENDEITIWIDNQRRIKEDDICSEYRVFSTVNRKVGKRLRGW